MMDRMKPKPDYVAAWETYRRVRRWLYVLLLAALVAFPALGICGALFARTTLAEHAQNVIGAIAVIVGLPWMLLVILIAFYLQLFVCPRCHRFFFMTWWYRNPFAQRCVNCRLPKWATEDIPEPWPVRPFS